jgi:GNAT superfamily N-acetyltransferase
MFRIERVRDGDVPLLRQLIGELADYEHLSDQMAATDEGLRAALFSARPAAEAVIAFAGDEPAGFALFFQNFSTFVGKPGLYLEDLFVRPPWRGRGLGLALLRHLAGIAVERGYGRMEWSVLDWNELALGFYRRLGARPMDQWTVYRLAGDDIRRLATPEPASRPDVAGPRANDS